MKTRSKALFAYLSEAGVLNGTPEQITYAKQCYRKLYKKNWKQQKHPRKELCIEVTLKQFECIVKQAKAHGMLHTPFARNAILQAATGSHIPYGYDRLLQILQLVSMAAIEAAKQSFSINRIYQLLEQAEQLLLHHTKTDEVKA